MLQWFGVAALLLSVFGCASLRPANTSHHPGSASQGGALNSAPNSKGPQEYGPPSPPLVLAPQPSMGTDAVYGPTAPPAEPQLPKYGPDAQIARPVVLVLGPGLARGYAYTGVIRALSDAKIRIGAIVGTEMGALVGALYAEDGSVNKLEWGIQHFRDDVFVNEGSVFSKLLDQDPAQKLDESLARVFGNRDIANAKVPLRILIQPAGAGARIYDRGPFRLLIRAALANADGFPPVEIDGAPAGSAAAVRPFDVQDAKALGIGPVVVVDVMDPKDSDRYPELKEADLVLQPDMGGIGIMDFSKRTDATFAGKAVTREHLDEIKKLIGMGAP